MQDPHTPDAGGWRPNKAAVLAASHYVAASPWCWFGFFHLYGFFSHP